VLATTDLPLSLTVPVRADDEAVLPCWTADPDLWFAESPSDVEDAKALCGPCPLREACLAGALERREPWGVWGGQLVVAGVVVPRKRPAAVPARWTSPPDPIPERLLTGLPDMHAPPPAARQRRPRRAHGAGPGRRPGTAPGAAAPARPAGPTLATRARLARLALT
jgi:WhiB family redox-sensing transcriptional regulator